MTISLKKLKEIIKNIEITDDCGCKYVYVEELVEKIEGDKI